MDRDDFMRFVGRGVAAQKAVDSVIAEQTTLPLTPRASTHAATCAKCGRAFSTPGQYRYRGSDGAPICRDARACAVRAEEKHGK